MIGSFLEVVGGVLTVHAPFWAMIPGGVRSRDGRGGSEEDWRPNREEEDVVDEEEDEKDGVVEEKVVEEEDVVTGGVWLTTVTTEVRCTAAGRPEGEEPGVGGVKQRQVIGQRQNTSCVSSESEILFLSVGF